MPDTSTSPTLSQAERRRLDDLERDILRHRVMRGHPPTGPIFPEPPAEEIERRIRNRDERLSGYKL